MKQAFIITVDLDDDSSIEGVKEDLRESAEADGYKVLSVNAWEHQILGPISSPGDPGLTLGTN